MVPANAAGEGPAWRKGVLPGHHAFGNLIVKGRKPDTPLVHGFCDRHIADDLESKSCWPRATPPRPFSPWNICKITLMETLICLIAAAGFVGAALAQQPGPAPTPGPEARQLAVWYGEWTYAGGNFATPLGPASKISGRMTGRPIQNGFAGEFIYDETGPGGVTRYYEIDFWDPATRSHGYLFIGNDGYVERGNFTMNGNVITFTNTILVEGKPYKIRGVETVAPDAQSYIKKIELCADGKTWVPCSELVFTKVAPAEKAR